MVRNNANFWWGKINGGHEFNKWRQNARMFLYRLISERKAPLTARTIHHIVARAGEEAKFPFSLHPHMLRHSTGFYLANNGHDTRAIQGYMGHANIKNTTMYTELSPKRYEKFWKD